MLKKSLVVLYMLSNNLSASTLSEGDEALQNNKIDKSIALYKLSARDGSDEANFKLGKIYYLKKYNKRDLDKAYEYFKKASDYGHIKSQYNLAVILSNKNFKYYDIKRSYELFDDLARQDYGNAQYKVGIYLLYGLGVKKDYSMAKAWFERAYFENNYKRASCGISTIYANGLGVIQNLGRARNFSHCYIDNYPLCKKVFYEFKLYKTKYTEDKGFKYGYYE